MPHFQTYRNRRFLKLNKTGQTVFQQCYFWKLIGTSSDCLKYIGASRIKNNWFRNSWSRPLRPGTMKMTGFRLFLKWILKVTSPKSALRIDRHTANGFWDRHFFLKLGGRSWAPLWKYMGELQRACCCMPLYFLMLWKINYYTTEYSSHWTHLIQTTSH